MKILIYTLLSFCISSGYAYSFSLNPNNDDQDDPKINQKDEKGKKQGKWVFLGKDQPEKGYPLEGKISEGSFEDDRKNGQWIMYYNDGETPKTQGVYVNNRPNGPFIKYHPNGKIKEQGTFNKRVYADSLKRFNEEGILIYESSHDETGKEAGKVKYFHDNGKPEFVYEAVNGTPTGKATRYWPNGDVKEEITFAADGMVQETSGEIERVNEEEKVIKPSATEVKVAPRPKADRKFKPNAYNKVYNDDKELWMEGDFKNGVLQDGRLYIYDEDGLLFKVEVYKDGKYHSDGQL
jgi:antitoxin component YwqK of YwqJK toxin-antitoxin module